MTGRSIFRILLKMYAVTFFLKQLAAYRNPIIQLFNVIN